MNIYKIFKQNKDIEKTVQIVATTVVFIDIDNSITPNQYPNNNMKDYSSTWNGAHSISDDLFKDLQSINGEKIWLTSWLDDAEETFKQGWSNLPWENDDEYYDWKVNSANKFLKNNPHVTKVIWLDDDLDKWKERILHRNELEYLLIQPKNYEGVSPGEVQQMINFSQKYNYL